MNECIIKLYFAANYSFIVWDAVQSFCWNDSQAANHPFDIDTRPIHHNFSANKVII